MLSGKMALWQLECVLYVPRNLRLKSGQNQVSSSREKLSKSLCGGASMAYMVSKPILVFSLILSQAEQYLLGHNRNQNTMPESNSILKCILGPTNIGVKKS